MRGHGDLSSAKFGALELGSHTHTCKSPPTVRVWSVRIHVQNHQSDRSSAAVGAHTYSWDAPKVMKQLRKGIDTVSARERHEIQILLIRNNAQPPLLWDDPSFTKLHLPMMIQKA